MNINLEEFLDDYLAKNLSIEVDDCCRHGFNGEHVEIKLVLNGKTISEGSIDIKRDEG